MYLYSQKDQVSFYKKFIAIVIIITFLSTSAVGPIYAQSVPFMPTPGTMVMQSQPYVPMLLKGMTVYPDAPLKFDFIIDSGHSELQGQRMKDESKKLVNYFLASMTVPKDDLWVNLSPHEENRIIPSELGKTELGRDLLAQDYLLKQLTASLMYPEEELGQKFWEKVYAKAQDKFGVTDIPQNVFSKVWILPESATVYENNNTVYVVESKLKVMTDLDYSAMQNNQRGKEVGDREVDKVLPLTSPRSGSLEVIPLSHKADKPQAYVSQIIKEIIIPAIEEEVNIGENFAPLRQIYNSLILAKWYKETIKNSILSQVYIDKNKIAGIDTRDVIARSKATRQSGEIASQKMLAMTTPEDIYSQYMDAYKKGVYDYIKEDYDAQTQEIIPRKYFSGGFHDADMAMASTLDESKVAESVEGVTSTVKVELEAQGAIPAKAGISEEIDEAMTSSQRLEEIRASNYEGFPLIDERTNLPEEVKSLLTFYDTYMKNETRSVYLKALIRDGNLRAGPDKRNIFEWVESEDDDVYVINTNSKTSLGELIIEILRNELSFESHVEKEEFRKWKQKVQGERSAKNVEADVEDKDRSMASDGNEMEKDNAMMGSDKLMFGNAVKWNEIDYTKLGKKPILVGSNFDVVKKAYDDDGNVLEKGVIKDPSKVIKGLEGIKDIEHPLVFVTHNGRPLTKGPEGLGLEPLFELMQEQMPGKKVILANGLTGPEVASQIKALKKNEVLLLTNFRLDPRAESVDEEKRKELIKEIVFDGKGESLFSLFISNGYASAPRLEGPSPSTSLIDFPEVLPSVVGPLMIKELQMLKPIAQVSKHPFVLMTGGAKIGDKIDATMNPLKKMRKGDVLIIYGQMAYTYLHAKAIMDDLEYTLGSSKIEYDYIDKATEILKLAREKGVKVILPRDHVETDDIKNPNPETTGITNSKSIRDGLVGADIGPLTILDIKEAVESGQLIFNNGTPGVFETKGLDQGTIAIAKMLAKAVSEGKDVIVGGGDAVAALKLAQVADQIPHQSTGGGSTIQVAGLKEGELWHPIIALENAAEKTKTKLSHAILKDVDVPDRAMASNKDKSSSEKVKERRAKILSVLEAQKSPVSVRKLFALMQEEQGYENSTFGQISNDVYTDSKIFNHPSLKGRKDKGVGNNSGEDNAMASKKEIIVAMGKQKTIGSRVAYLLYFGRGKEMSQKELGNEIGVSNTTIGKIIKGKNVLNLDELLGKIADVFEIDVNLIKFGGGTPDQAMAADVGGIDMNDIKIDRTSTSNLIEFDVDAMQPLLDMDITGFAPIIIDIVPLPSIMPILGLNDVDREKRQAKKKDKELLELSAAVKE